MPPSHYAQSCIHKGFEGRSRYNAIEPTNGWQKNTQFWLFVAVDAAVAAHVGSLHRQLWNARKERMGIPWKCYCLHIHLAGNYVCSFTQIKRLHIVVSDEFWFFFVACLVCRIRPFIVCIPFSIYLHIHSLSFCVILVCTSQIKRKHTKEMHKTRLYRVHSVTHSHVHAHTKSHIKLCTDSQNNMQIVCELAKKNRTADTHILNRYWLRSLYCSMANRP